jgi:hypothetical protein
MKWTRLQQHHHGNTLTVCAETLCATQQADNSFHLDLEVIVSHYNSLTVTTSETLALLPDSKTLTQSWTASQREYHELVSNGFTPHPKPLASMSVIQENQE